MNGHEDVGDLEVLVLGPMRARVNEQNFDIGSAQQQALLARLLISKDRPVSITRLCEELWDSQAPRDPVHALQSRVSRLRSSIPTLEIEQIGSGYQLDQLYVQTDIEHFERLIEEARWLIEDGVFVQADDRLRRALGLWRGQAFADIETVPALQAESARLEKLWASALADRIDIDLALGSENDVIPELAALVKENPLLERFWGQLMVALYRQNRVQEALDTYRRARKIFSDSFGVDPNGELGQLHLSILKEEPSATLLRIPPAARQISSLHTLCSEQTSLAEPISSNETDVLLSLLKKRQAIILTGDSGIGKTHILRSVRDRLESQHCHAPLLSPSALSQSIKLGVFAGISGSLSEDWRSAADVIDTFARNRSTTVLLVDNVTMLDDASLYVVHQLVNTARIPVIITAQSLTNSHEAIRDLYDSGDLLEVPLKPLSHDESAELAKVIVGAPLAPQTLLRILETASGNPFRLREIITGSIRSGRLVQSECGWKLHGAPVPSPRLAQLLAARFDGLNADALKALSLIAVAGELPRAAFNKSQLNDLESIGALALTKCGWLRLADPFDREVLRSRCSEMLWNDYTQESDRLASRVSGL